MSKIENKFGHINRFSNHCYFRSQRKKMKGRENRRKFSLYTIAIVFLVAVVLGFVFNFCICRVSVIKYESADNTDLSVMDGEFDGFLGKKTTSLVFKNNSFRNLFSIFKGRLTAKENELLAKYPQFSEINVKCKLRKIVVSAVPRESAVCVRSDGNYILLDVDGVVCKIADDEIYEKELSEDYPVVAVNLSFNNLSVGKKAEFLEDYSWADVLRLYYAVAYDEDLNIRVNEILFQGNKNAYFRCDDGFYVYFGRYDDIDDIYEKCNRLASIYISGKFDLKDGMLNLSGEGYDVFTKAEEITE